MKQAEDEFKLRNPERRFDLCSWGLSAAHVMRLKMDQPLNCHVHDPVYFRKEMGLRGQSGDCETCKWKIRRSNE